MDEKNKIIDKAQKLLQKGYLDKAIAEYQKIVDQNAKDVTVRLRIGDLYVKAGKKDDAIKEYGAVAKLYTQKGFYLKAIAVYKQMLKLDESLLDIYYKLADLYAKQKLIADAVSSLSVLVAFYEKNGKNDDAIDTLKKMTAVDPQNIGVRLKLAEHYQKKGFTNDAFAEYRIALDSLLKDGKLDKAEKLCQELYADNKRDVNILEGLTEIYKKKGNDTQLTRYYKELANLYKEKGEAEKRKEIYKNILKIFPDDNDALNALGRKPSGPDKKVESAATLPEEEVAKESLIAWPEVTKDISEKPQVEAQELTTPASLKEEPLISWNEMIEVNYEVRPAEAKETVVKEEPLEEAPLIEMPDIKVTEVREEKEAPLIDIKELTPSEEEVTVKEVAKEVSPENIKPVEELLLAEETEATTITEQPAPEQNLDGLGLEAFMPESTSIREDIEPQPEEGYVDLSSELRLEGAMDSLTESWTADEKGEGTLTEFKQGVKKQLSKEDTETHYNLAIAYMEMELYDDAIREFNLAIKDPVFEFDCYIRLGLSLMAKGDYDEAISNFLEGLKRSGRTGDERKGLLYELGLAYEASGNIQEAVEVFKSTYEMDKGFRDVSSKVKELTKKSRKKGKFDVIPAMDDMIEVEIL
jgi:tetratricopeptide (TPR) repeat protein